MTYCYAAMCWYLQNLLIDELLWKPLAAGTSPPENLMVKQVLRIERLLKDVGIIHSHWVPLIRKLKNSRQTIKPPVKL